MWDWLVQTGRTWRESRQKRHNEMLWRFCLWLPTEAWRTHAQWSDSDSDNNIQKADLHTHIHTMLIFFPACSQKTWICLRRLIFRFSCTACHFWIREGFCFVLGFFFPCSVIQLSAVTPTGEVANTHERMPQSWNRSQDSFKHARAHNIYIAKQRSILRTRQGMGVIWL